MLDTIFGVKNFRNEIVWKRTSAHANVGKRYGVITDFLLFYTKSLFYTWNQQYVAYADTGIDGILRFQDDPKSVKTALIQVKSGKVGVAQVRDFAHVVNRDGAPLGPFLTLEPPTSKMLEEAGKLGFYTTPLGNLRIPRLQIRTVAQLLAGEGFQITSTALLMGVAQVQRIERDAGQQEMKME